MKEVFFIKPGNAYGYGYGAGEIGLVYDTDQKRDTGAKTKDGKPIMQTIARGFEWLQQNGIVRAATAADKKVAEEKEAARRAARTPKKAETPDETGDGEKAEGKK